MNQLLLIASLDDLTRREIPEKLEQPISTVETRTPAGLSETRKLLTVRGLPGELK
jgi:hypothetical protein